MQPEHIIFGQFICREPCFLQANLQDMRATAHQPLQPKRGAGHFPVDSGPQPVSISGGKYTEDQNTALMVAHLG
jgi:hypothetical protein